MNKNQMILASAVLIAGSALLAAGTKWQSCVNDMQSRFPEIDNKTIRRALRKYYINSARDTYGDMSELSYEECDAIFLTEVQKLPSRRTL